MPAFRPVALKIRRWLALRGPVTAKRRFLRGHPGGCRSAHPTVAARGLAAGSAWRPCFLTPEPGSSQVGQPACPDRRLADAADHLGALSGPAAAASDHPAVLNGIEAVNAGLSPALGHSQILDAERAFYMGLSMGAVSGVLNFRARTYLFMQAEADPLIGADSSDVWARAFDAGLVTPDGHEVSWGAG